MISSADSFADIAGAALSAEDMRDLEGTDQPMELALPDTVDERQLLDALHADLIRGEHARAVLAEAEMRRVAEFNRQVGEHRTVDGVGQLIARIPLDTFLHWCATQGTEFWYHQDSIDFLAARNPGMLVETARKPTIIVDRPLAGGGAKPGLGVDPARPVASSRGGRWRATA